MNNIDIKFVLKSVYAGLSIGIGTIVYMLNPGPLGAFLFTIGLFICVNNKFNLFTGKVGYETKWSNILQYIVMILGNAFGIIAIVMLMYCTGAINISMLTNTATHIINTRMSTPYIGIILGSIGCGMLMSHAVDRPNRPGYEDNYNNILSYIPMLYCVPIFILCGFPHCIADISYHVVYGGTIGYNINQLYIWLCSVLGNIIGCQIMGQLYKRLN
jgi:formate/nitrite transporter FocA (FNT family)